MSRLMFSLIVPTRQRTEPLRRLLESIKATTQDLSQLEVVLVMDEDDEESIRFQFDGVPLKRVTVPRGLSMGALNMSGYRAAAGRHLMLLNDDVVVETPGWDEQVLAAFRSFPDRMVLVNVNDLLFRDTLCTFPFLTREFCSLMDGICPPGYLRYRIDDHIHNIFDLLSLLDHHRRIFLPDVIFAHMNVAKPEEQGSAQYVPDPATHEIDSRLFEALLPERKRIAIQAMHQIEGRLSSEQHSAWQRKLETVTDSVAIRLREHARWLPPRSAGPEDLPKVTIGMAGNPLAHFLETGAYAGWRPNPLFDPVYYLTENPDVAAAGLNPLAHFLERGAQEGRRPNPLFDPTYYLKANPDVAAAGVNPLAHFLDVGAAQGRKPNPLFDTAYYLQQNPDVAAAGINPLAHFLERGAKEGRRPNPLFDTAYYLHQNPDVVESGMNPLVHFLEFGAQEGRRPSPAFDTAAYLHRNPEVSRAGTNLVPLSVVIPTHNRGALLTQTLEACHRNAGGCDLEIIVIDDGSTDDTAKRLAALSATIPDLHWHSVRKVGPARARNIGADAARHDVIVFLGDDIQPLNADFFRIHASLHVRHPAANLAVLGKVEWPQWGAARITPTMLHVQGRGGEQFGYSHLTPYQLAGWQYFYTANVSVKKALVRDWILEGFDTGFSTAAYEDLEFAYRQFRPQKGLRIFYDPAALAAHHHHYTLPQFMDRQFSAGKALIHLLELHPELAATCNFQEFVEALRASRDFPAEHLVSDYQLAIEEAKAWARHLDEEGELGRQPWHEDFLSAVLELCLLDGFLSAWPQKDANLAAARALLLNRFCQRLRPSLPPELADWSFLAKGLVSPSLG